MNDQGNLTSIIVALIGLLTLVITVLGGGVLYFGKWFAKNYGSDLKAHTKAAIESTDASNKLTKAVEKNTDVSNEMIAFMKNLNGRLAKATSDTLIQTKEIIKEAKR